MDNEMVIMVGLPGAGKSTYVKNNLPGHVKCSADDYHMVDGVYKFDPANLGKAHENCQIKCVEALKAKLDVVIDNTNLRIEHINQYINMAKAHGCERVTIVVVDRPHDRCAEENVHGVPVHAYPRLVENYERVCYDIHMLANVNVRYVSND